MSEVYITASQAKAIAVIAANHPDSRLVLYPPIKGSVGVNAVEANQLYLVLADGLLDPSVAA